MLSMSHRRCALNGALVGFGLTALLAAAWTPVASAEEADLSNESCLTCHAVEDFKGSDGRPLRVDGDKFGTSAHGSLNCTSCHDDVTEIPHPAKLKARGIETCTTCHDDAVSAYRKSIHGKARLNDGANEAASCTDCHGSIHSITPHSEESSPTHWKNLAATCARCHGNQELAQKFKIPVVRPVEAYLKSAHARAVAGGTHGATCADCHGAHLILPSNDPESSIWKANVPQTCGACHKEILVQYTESVHGEALANRNTQAPVCTDCHGEHRILAPSEPSSPVFAANVPANTCGRCHADERLVEKYGLNGGNVSAFQDSFHGMALRAGKLSVANCASCHGVHDIRRSSDPRSSVSSVNLPNTCGKCHPGAGSSFKLGPVHGGATSSIGPLAVGWIRFIYIWLIVVTIGGMTVHNLLDWQRKARHPEAPSPPVVGETPTRMVRVMRWQHGLIMISFPILVYTGFALTYPKAWWAAPLLQWENDIGLRGLVHRVAAVVMIAALLWHIIHLIVSAPARACMLRILPRPHDLTVVFGTLAYYFGLRKERPLSGTFNYAEKAEYWAFLWGSGLMSFTGFLLWFENLTLRYLPSWVPDVATALHFYEAILATLAILVWHLYWVIFDPEVYPMDWTWWTGKPPASRVHERREEGEGD
ncbi:MAG TPA: cytochrome c3 family protein [Candidatus Acidoferrales bacterium]|nr:cytochrome c3 family protein [Candidatus Acidoferrales bacterium]